jgi:hypothetical protein
MIHDITNMTYDEAKSYVYSLMLFPGAKENAKREKAYRYFLDELTLCELPNDDNLSKLIEKRQFSGMMIGFSIHCLIEAKTNITDIARKICETFNLYNGAIPQDMSYTNVRHNLWPLFRPVAHLWTAAVEVHELNGGDILECPPTPGIPTGLAGFLLIALNCLQGGMQTRMSRRGPTGFLFDAEIMHDFKLPQGLTFKLNNPG